MEKRKTKLSSANYNVKKMWKQMLFSDNIAIKMSHCNQDKWLIYKGVALDTNRKQDKILEEIFNDKLIEMILKELNA